MQHHATAERCSSHPLRVGLIGCACLLGSVLHAQTTVWRVDDDAQAGGDGAQWSSAFQSLQQALDVARSGDQIWVAEGVYVPSVALDPNDPRTATFLVASAVRIYGGFQGSEATLAERAGSFEATELSGDIGAPLDTSDNTYHVVTVRAGPRIDGFAIHGGRADNNASILSVRGAGVYCEPATGVDLLLANCTVRDNMAFQGAGIYVQAGSLAMKWCTLRSNTANLGGALYVMSAGAHISHSRFVRNHASGNGGAMFLSSISWSPVLGPAVGVFNCEFQGNSATRGGAAYMGGSQFSSGNALWAQCTFAYNVASDRGGAVCAITTSPIIAHNDIYNSILFGNQSPAGAQIYGRHKLFNSDVEGGSSAGVNGNIDADPLFVDGPGGDLRLRPGSPANDAGSAFFVPSDYFDLDGDALVNESIPFDLDGAPRFVDDQLAPDSGCCNAPMVDMGAHETQ